MPDIREMLHAIDNFLEGSDHSASPLFRKLASEYAEICAALNGEIEKCKKYIDAGALSEAVRLNLKTDPPLTERIRLLNFKGRPQWLELCRLYHAPCPMDFDLDTVRALDSKRIVENAKNLDELLTDWRRIARTGSLEEKTLLLRKLMRANPDSPVWRANLEQIERAYMAKLLGDAAEAQKAGDLRKLNSVYNEIVSSEWLHPVQDSALSPFLKDVAQYQAEQLRSKIDGQLKRIADAYQLNDLALLGHTLEEWNALASVPGFHVSEIELRQVEEARNAFLEGSGRAEKDARIQELLALFASQLSEDPPDFLNICRTRQELELLSAPPDPILEQRFLVLEEDAALNKKRKHIRRCLGGFLFAVLLVLGLAFAIHTFQNYSEVTKICASMRALIEKNDPEGVLPFYDKLKEKKPHTALAVRVIALKQEAEHLIRQKNAESAEFGAILKQLAEFQTADYAERDETADFFKKAEEFKGYRTDDQKNEFQEQKKTRVELLAAIQSDRETDFDNQVRAFENRYLSFGARLLQNKDVPAAKYKTELDALNAEVKVFLASLSKIPENRLDAFRTSVENGEKTSTEAIRNLEIYQKTLKKLYSPESLDEYSQGLAEMPQYAPSEFKSFQNAVAAAGSAAIHKAMLFFGSDRNSLAKVWKIADSMRQIQSPVSDDLLLFLPHKDAMNRAHNALSEIRNILLPQWKRQTISLSNDGKIYVFHLQGNDKPELERAGGRLGGAFRSLSLKIRLPDNKSADVIFNITRNEDKTYRLSILKNAPLYSAGLPDAFDSVSAKELMALASERHSLAAPYGKLAALLSELEKEKTPFALENTILSQIHALSTGANDIHPLAVRAISNLLLALYADLSPVNSRTTEKLRNNRFFSGKTDEWLAPDAFTDSPGAAAFSDFFHSDSFQKEIRSAVLTKRFLEDTLLRAPIPAGVLYRSADTVKLLFFQKEHDPGADCLLLLNDKDGNARLTRFPIPTDDTVADLSNYPGEFRAIANGQIFFTPMNKPSTAQFLKGIRKQAEKEDAEILFFPKSIPLEVSNDADSK